MGTTFGRAIRSGVMRRRAHRRLKPVQPNPMAVEIKNTINMTAIVKPISIWRDNAAVGLGVPSSARRCAVTQLSVVVFRGPAGRTFITTQTRQNVLYEQR